MYIVDDVHYFANITDFISSVKNAPLIPGRCQSSLEKGDSRWYGTENIEQSWEMLENGTLDIRGERMLRETEKLMMNSHKRVQFNSIKGFVPNVPNYLMGIPESMIDREIHIYRDKIINILVNTSVNAGISVDYIFEKAQEVLRVIIDLETQGYRVNLYKMIGSSTGGSGEKNRVLGFIKMKDDRERINLKKLIFPMTHPSMQRRLDFRFRETHGEVDVTHDGYGSQRNWDKAYVSKYFKRVCNGDFLYSNLEFYDKDWYKASFIQKDEPKED